MNDADGCECGTCLEDESSGALQIELGKTTQIRRLCEKAILDLGHDLSRSYTLAERALMAVDAQISAADVLVILNGDTQS